MGTPKRGSDIFFRDSGPESKRASISSLTPMFKAMLHERSVNDVLFNRSPAQQRPQPPAAVEAQMCLVCARTFARARCGCCDRAICGSCLRECEGCAGGLFCTFCTAVDYSARYERTFCAPCVQGAKQASSANARDQGDDMDMR
ncbi:hypothetical protein M885DRAFT_506683 [Pelagophyceae sp. CCMP2097]|nr:hypothetical protein M885DRAFT_506683 [Pelagophyceae sp. CCMP2097]|mmetsp:Transcript_20093/g.68068  ORF Transcript_20093/g.68068 Transcript_20093/m.68068 type:complete len:144 (+) Transcript_20093:62-493(+)